MGAKLETHSHLAERLELAMARVDRLQTALSALLACIDARQWASPQLQQAIDAAMAALEE